MRHTKSGIKDSVLQDCDTWPMRVEEKRCHGVFVITVSSVFGDVTASYVLSNIAGRPIEDLVGDHQGGTRASWRTPGLWPTTLEQGVAIDLH